MWEFNAYLFAMLRKHGLRPITDGTFLVRGVPAFHDLPRSGACAGGEMGRRPHGIPRRSGLSRPAPAYQARAVRDGGGADIVVYCRRLDDGLGERSGRSALGAAASTPRSLGVGSGTDRQFY